MCLDQSDGEPVVLITVTFSADNCVIRPAHLLIYLIKPCVCMYCFI